VYSQIGQDDWVVDQLKGKQHGVFIDIGAHDGVELSNSLLLETVYGWHGICVEPHPDTFQQLETNRSCMVLNKAVWSSAGKVQFNRSHKDSMLSSVAMLGDVTVEAVTLGDLCDMVGPIIDYISIDTEGAEVEILKAFDVASYDIKCWTVEHNHRQQDIDWLKLWFNRAGYKTELMQWDLAAWKV